MKTFLFSLLVCCFVQVKAQRYITAEGEFMDTTHSIHTSCADQGLYYYAVGGKYFKNSASLLKDARVYLQADNKTYTGDGYITFRCRIGCDGKPANKVQVLQTDATYVTIHFEKELVNELYGFFKTLDGWKIAKDKRSDPMPYTTFITFKIRDGKIDQIIP